MKQESQAILGGLIVGAAFVYHQLLMLMTSDIDPVTGQYRPWIDWSCVDLPCLIRNGVSRPVLIAIAILAAVLVIGLWLIEKKNRGKEASAESSRSSPRRLCQSSRRRPRSWAR